MGYPLRPRPASIFPVAEEAALDRSILLPIHQAAGARLQGPADSSVLLTYGDVPGEYRAAQDGCVLFDETDRGRIEVSGEEAPAFLHRLLANDVRSLAPGRGQRNLLLSSKGKVLFDLDLFRDEDRFWLSVPPARARGLLAALDMYLFAEKVKLADASASHAPLALCGPDADGVARRTTGIEPPAEDHAFVRGVFEGSPLSIARLTVAGSTGLRLDAGPEKAPVLWRCLREAGAHPAGIVVSDILRVEAGQALPGVDIDENVYPQEARLESAFSLTKGCYVGQEVVAKIDTYGGLNKRLVALKVSHDDPVPHGTRLHRQDEGEWRDLGVITSWAYSFALDTGLVLAYVKRRHQKSGTVFRIGDGPATAEIVPIPVRTGAVPVTGGFE